MARDTPGSPMSRPRDLIGGVGGAAAALSSSAYHAASSDPNALHGHALQQKILEVSYSHYSSRSIILLSLLFGGSVRRGAARRRHPSLSLHRVFNEKCKRRKRRPYKELAPRGSGVTVFNLRSLGVHYRELTRSRTHRKRIRFRLAAESGTRFAPTIRFSTTGPNGYMYIWFYK